MSSFGAGDADARVLRASGLNQIEQVKIRIENGGLASQAVGPPLSDREMGSLVRNFRDIGKRFASARALKQQKVASDDSVLGLYSRHQDRRGLGWACRAAAVAVESFACVTSFFSLPPRSLCRLSLREPIPL